MSTNYYPGETESAFEWAQEDEGEGGFGATNSSRRTRKPSRPNSPWNCSR